MTRLILASLILAACGASVEAPSSTPLEDGGTSAACVRRLCNAEDRACLDGLPEEPCAPEGP